MDEPVCCAPVLLTRRVNKCDYFVMLAISYPHLFDVEVAWTRERQSSVSQRLPCSPPIASGQQHKSRHKKTCIKMIGLSGINREGDDVPSLEMEAMYPARAAIT